MWVPKMSSLGHTGRSDPTTCGPSTSFDEISDYRRLKMLNIVDEFTREALAMEVDRSITADRLIDVIETLVVCHGASEHLRMDSGWIIKRDPVRNDFLFPEGTSSSRLVVDESGSVESR